MEFDEYDTRRADVSRNVMGTVRRVQDIDGFKAELSKEGLVLTGTSRGELVRQIAAETARNIPFGQLENVFCGFPLMHLCEDGVDLLPDFLAGLHEGVGTERLAGMIRRGLADLQLQREISQPIPGEGADFLNLMMLNFPNIISGEVVLRQWLDRNVQSESPPSIGQE